MRKPDLTSVIIPCHNQSRFLGQAIDSVRAQTYSPHEIVVVDDGSTDDTARIVASIENVRCVRRTNGGLASARNAGLEISNGDYIVFLDADDRLLPNALLDWMRCLNNSPACAFAYGHVKLIASDGSPLPTPPQTAVEGNHYFELLRRNYIWTTGAVMYRRPVFDSVGGFNTAISGSADFDLNARITRLWPICCSSTSVLEYRRHAESMSRDYALMLKTALTARRLQSEFVKGNKLHEEALRCGIRGAQEDYGEKLIDKARNQIRQGMWPEAISGLLVLLRYYPQGFVKRLRRKVSRVLI